MTTRAEPGAGQDRVNRLLALGCFTAVIALHAAAFSAAGFPAKQETPAPETRELFLALQPAAREEPPAAAEPPSAPAAALPPRVLPDPAPEAPLPAAEEAAAAPPVEAVETAETPAAYAAAEGGAAAGDAVPANSVPPRKRAATDAEYLALVMDRLEKNKIYPLSVRKRGIEGDITVEFTIRRDGTVSDMRADPSGHRFLVQAALETIRSAAPFPAPEGREAYRPKVQIRYRLEDR